MVDLDTKVRQWDEWDEEIDFRRYLHVLWSRKWLLVVLALFLGGVTAYAVKDLPPTYVATATLIIEKEEEQIMGIKDIVKEGGYRNATHVGTQLGVIRSRENLTAVMNNLNLRAYYANARESETSLHRTVAQVKNFLKRYFGSTAGDIDQDSVDFVLERLLKNLSIRPVRDTELIEIAFSTSSPRMAAAVCNEVAQTYIDNSLEYRRERISRASNWLESRKEELKQRVVDAESRLRKFLSTRPLSYIESLPEVENNPTIQRLRDAESALELKLSELASRYGPEHPKIIAAKSDLAELEDNLAAELRKLSGQLVQSYASIAATVAPESLGSGGLRDSQLETLMRDVATNKQLHNEVTDRHREVQLLKELETAGARMVDPAVEPVYPEGPGKRFLVIAMSLFGGLLGVAITVGLEWMDKSLKTSQDVETRIGLPVLSMVPLLSRKQRDMSTRDIADSTKHKQSAFSESIKTLRTALLLSHVGHEDCIVVLVTSAVEQEGKTTISSNLARSFSELGKKTLLIDADMRRPSVHKLLQLGRCEGLSELIAQVCPMKNCLHRKAIGEADVIPAGAVPPNPLELLSSKSFEDMMIKLRQYYEVIVIDSAPTMNVSDSIVLSQSSTGVLLVVRSDSTAYQVARAASIRLRQANARILGVALNQVDVSKISRYGKYSYYGDYYGTYNTT